MHEERKKFLQIIQGELPSEKYMRNKLPGIFKNLKRRLNAVKDVNTQGIEFTKEIFQSIEKQLGTNLEGVYSMDDLHLKELYKILNFELISFIEQAEEISQKGLEGIEKNIGKEPGE